MTATPTGFALLAAASTVIDGIAAMIALWLVAHADQRGRILTLWRLTLAVLMVGVVFAIKLIALRALGLNFFGLIHIVYIDLIVLAPLIALILLVIERHTRTRDVSLRLTKPVRCVAAFVLLAPTIGWYASFIEPYQLRFEQVDVPVSIARGLKRPVRIGVLADIQASTISDHECNAIAQLMAAKPDLIVIPGDIFQGWPSQFRQQLPHFRELLSTLHAPGGVFFVLGDCEDLARAHALLDGLDIRILLNEIVNTTVGSQHIVIGGTELDYQSPGALNMIRQLERLPSKDDLRMLLSHRPDAALQLSPSSRVDLVIAGHTHGGQVNVPLVGPLITFSNVPRSAAAGGLHKLNGNLLYVSRGLGQERRQAPPMRFLCPPEITLLVMHSEQEADAAHPTTRP